MWVKLSARPVQQRSKRTFIFVKLNLVIRKILPDIAFDANFQKLWWAQILSQVAFNTLLYTLIIRIAERTASNTAVSFFILSFSIPAVIFGLFAGVWVDRLDRRFILIATNVLRTALIPLFYLAELGGFVAIYPLAVVTSIVTQFFIPAEASKLATMVPHKILHQANSLFTFTLYTAIIVGPILAGPGLKFLGLGKLFIGIFAFFAVAAFLTTLLPKDRGERTEAEERQLHLELFDALKHIWSTTRVRGGVLLLTFSQTMIAMIAAAAPGYARSVLGIEVADTSLFMLAPAALGMIAGALYLSRFGHNYSRRWLVIAGVFLAGVELVGLGAVRGFDDILPFINITYAAMVLLFLLGSANAMIDVPANTAIQIHTPENLRGRVYGILGTMINGAAFLPVLFAGIIADVFGVPVLIIVMGVLVFFTGFYLHEKARTLV